jgi:signal transduction histidine kinase/DNA-binding response OmpR family regulator
MLKFLLFLIAFAITSPLFCRDSIFIKEINTSFVLDNKKSINRYLCLTDSLSDTAIFENIKILRTYLKRGIETSERLKYDKGIFEFIVRYMNIDDYSDMADTLYILQAIELAKSDLIGFDEKTSNKEIYHLYSQLGLKYMYEEEYYLAIKNFEKSIEYAKVSNLHYTTDLSKINLIYELLAYDDEELEYYMKSLIIVKEDIGKSPPDFFATYELQNANMGLARLYSEFGQVDSSFYYAAECLENMESLESFLKQDTSLTYAQKYTVKRSLFRNFLALFEIQDKGIKLSLSPSEILEKIALYKIADDFHTLKFQTMQLRLAIAENNIQQSKRLFEQIAQDIIEDNKELCSKYYELIGDYNKALNYQRAFGEDERNRLTSLGKKQINFIHAEFNAEEREAKIITLKREALLNIKQNEGLTVGLFLIIGLLFFVVYHLILRTKQRTLLEKDVKNKEVIIKQGKKLSKIRGIQERMYANISHELRTPLTLIKGNLNQITVNAESKIFVEKALAQSKDLEMMITQIMDLSKAETKGLILNCNRFYIEDLLAYLKHTFYITAQVKDIQVELDLSQNVQTEIVTDIEKLTTILKNLFSNALKFTSPGGKLSIRSTVENQTLTIKVQDTGRGIAASDLPHVFDRYYQSLELNLASEGGFGIGLAICKEYIDFIKGTISVESEMGIGSTFTITVPLRLEKCKKSGWYAFPAKLPQSNTISLNSGGLPQGEFILIVEDNIEMSEYIKGLLDKSFDVVVAHNGREAIKILERSKPILIISDLMMPIMDGMKMISQIKLRADWAVIPILILTAKDNVLSELKAIRIGVDSYVTKPFDDDELLANIHNILDFAEKRGNALISAREDKDTGSISTIQTSVDSTISESDRIWLKKLEEKITPIISDYDLNIEKIAEVLSMSTTHINRKMKEATGLTPKKYVTELRLLAARKLLENRIHDSVKVVAYTVGFKSYKTFSRNFKNRFGKYPSEYLD